MSIRCQQDDRRDAVRRMSGRNGLDFVEVLSSQTTLRAYFLGKLPPELAEKRAGSERYLRVEGGDRVTGIRVTSVEPVVDPDPAKDDVLVVRVDRPGDFSTYALRLVDVEGVDPRYARAEFSFKASCPSDLDCAPAPACEPAALPEPGLTYLAKDYASFRQLVYDRLALLVPEWRERHVPDLGVALVELLAYAGDYLSYYQDAVATEAYLGTARRRISVRRHCRLVDYRLHEGCNARAWVAVGVSSDVTLDRREVAFVTGINDALPTPQTALEWSDLRAADASTFDVFEPLALGRSTALVLRAAHDEIRLYTWGAKECCLERGSTSATLLDAWVGGDGASQSAGRALQLAPGDVLLFEEVRGPKTGLAADADPTRRHVVRLTSVTPGEDPVIETDDGRPTPTVEVEWSAEDALPFELCVSAIANAPGCPYVETVSVARGNLVLVDHGRTVGPEDLGVVGVTRAAACCSCAGEPGDVAVTAAAFRPYLAGAPITYAAPLPRDATRPASARALATQDVRRATPQIRLASTPERPWTSRADLVDSGAGDADFVAEIDDDGVAHLRFGDGELGLRPAAGTSFSATYRVGCGAAGNVGAEAISRVVLGSTVDGVTFTVRNPLPASGGVDPEPIAEAKLFAPHAFRARIERAVTAEDYSELAGRDAAIQRASTRLAWTGSWYESDVAVDPLGTETADAALRRRIERALEPARRIGHDLAVTPAAYVPVDLALEVCALPHYQRAHVKAALLDAFGNRRLAGGRRGFFHPDELTFGEGVLASKIVATAMAVPGVECVTIARLGRLFEAPNGEIENGILPLRSSEIARLDNDPNHPERGRLSVTVRGGR